MPSKVGASHNPRCWCWRSAWRSAASGSATSAQMADDLSQPGWVQAPGRVHQDGFGLGGGVGGQVVGAGGQHRGVGGESSPAVTGPGRSRPGGRGTTPGRSAHSWWRRRRPVRSRARSQLAVEAAWMPWSAPAAPRPSTAARRWSHWPSRRSASRRRARVCSARAASVSSSRSWAASPSTTSASAPSPCGNLSEHLFDPMAETYQAHPRTQAPRPNWGQLPGGTPCSARPAGQRSYGVAPLPGRRCARSPETTRLAVAPLPDFSPVTKAVSPTLSSALGAGSLRNP